MLEPEPESKGYVSHFVKQCNDLEERVVNLLNGEDTGVVGAVLTQLLAACVVQKGVNVDEVIASFRLAVQIHSVDNNNPQAKA